MSIKTIIKEDNNENDDISEDKTEEDDPVDICPF